MQVRLALLFVLAVACSKAEPRPGQPELEAASSRIASSTGGELARGNTPAAKARAEAVAAVLAELDRKLFVGQDDDKVFTRTESFMVHCQHGAEGIAFLIHVPQFKRYKDDVRRTLVEAAWAAAEVATRDLAGDAPLKLGVGLRGSLMYGATAVGVRGGEPSIELGSAVDLDPLYPFFVGPAPAQAEAAPARPPAVAPEGAPPEPPEPPPPPAKLHVQTMHMQFLAASLVDREIRAHDEELQGCATRLAPGDTYDYHLALAGDGKVKKLEPIGNSEPPAALTTCLNQIAKTWTFPKKQLKLTKPEGGSLRFAYQAQPID